MSEARERIEIRAEERELEVEFIEGHDDAILGVVDNGESLRVAYDVDQMAATIMKAENWDLPDAYEHIEVSFIQQYINDNDPVFIEGVVL